MKKMLFMWALESVVEVGGQIVGVVDPAIAPQVQKLVTDAEALIASIQSPGGKTT